MGIEYLRFAESSAVLSEVDTHTALVLFVHEKAHHSGPEHYGVQRD